MLRIRLIYGGLILALPLIMPYKEWEISCKCLVG